MKNLKKNVFALIVVATLVLFSGLVNAESIFPSWETQTAPSQPVIKTTVTISNRTGYVLFFHLGGTRELLQPREMRKWSFPTDSVVVEFDDGALNSDYTAHHVTMTLGSGSFNFTHNGAVSSLVAN